MLGTITFPTPRDLRRNVVAARPVPLRAMYSDAKRTSVSTSGCAP